MPGRSGNRLSIKDLFTKRRTHILIILIIAFLVIDGALGWYIITYSIADKELDETSLDYEILQLERSFNELLVIRSQDSVQMLLDNPIELQFSGNPVDFNLGDGSNAIAVLTDDDMIHYFPPGQTSEQYFFELEDVVDLIGIYEAYSPIGDRPEMIVAATSNASGDAVHLISIETQETVWTYHFNSSITITARSDNTGYFSIGLETNEILHFGSFSPTPRMIYQIPNGIDEVEVARSGIFLFVLFDNGSKLSHFSTVSSDPILTVDLPSGSKNLQLRMETEYAYVQVGEKVLEIFNGNVSTRLSEPGLITYTVPKVVDRVYVSKSGEIQGYKDRQLPNWKGVSSYEVNYLSSDIGGDLIIGWGDQRITLIDDSESPLGNDTLWTLLGFMVIFETAFLIIFGLWDNIRNMRKEVLYVVIIGAIAGILVAYIFQDQDAIDWYGVTAYISLAAALAALSTLVSYRTDAGLANIIIGLVVGIMAAIPIAFLAHFIMQVGGYQFPDSPIYSLAKLIYTGLKMGIVGGIIGWIAHKVIRG
jgi:hypothetical protein